MTLAADLARARSEEDVKDAYIRALGLRHVFKGLVDIQTDKIWFEAKEAATPTLIMFAQLLTYVRGARRRGEPIPAFLAVVDREKAALLPIEHALPVLADETISWPASGSAAGRELAARIAPYLDGHYTTWRIADHEPAFLAAIKAAIRDGQIVRTPITPDNLRQVFDRWVEMVGSELGAVNPGDYAVLFFADMMHDGQSTAMTNLPARLLYDGRKPVFLLGSQTYELASDRGYRDFWAIYDRPPEQKHRHYLLERRDSLLPVDEQKFKGAFYTPLHIVDRAYDQLTATLGADWQERYIVWDMCCGVGNLEVKHSNYRNVFMSTLDQADIDIMRASKTCAGATMFQYDYLNDDVTDFGEIDYALTGKVPVALRQAIADAKEGRDGAKPILVLINPPYAEAKSGLNTLDKTGVANTQVSHGMKDLSYAARELFAQFLHRVMAELPKADLGLFSTLKYVNSPNFSEFRKRWTATYLNGLVVHSKAFDGLKGDFPIGFLLWRLSTKETLTGIITSALDKDGLVIAEKNFVSVANSGLLSAWLPRFKTNALAVPLKNAIMIQASHAKVTTWHDGSVGYLLANGNDFQQASTLTALFSSVFSAGNGYYITPTKTEQAAVVFAVRRLIKPTWLNNRDQFLQPSTPLPNEFRADCLAWMLFNGSNLTAGADGLRWNDRDWSLVNHFIPFTETEVEAGGRFESDFMVRHMKGMAFSPEARAVLDEGRALWRRFHRTSFPRKIRDELRLNRPDAGWYQIRRALEAYGDTELTDFDPFKRAYAALTAKLRPLVYEYGFLPR